MSAGGARLAAKETRAAKYGKDRAEAIQRAWGAFMSAGEDTSITDQNFTGEEMRASEAEADAALREQRAEKGLEYLADSPAPGTEEGHDKFSRLAAEYNWVAGVAPKVPAPHIYFGKKFIICGMWRQAATALERAVKLKPEDADAHCLYARALAMCDQLDAARAEYLTACRLDSRLLEARFEKEIVEIRIEEGKRRREMAALN